MALLEMHHVSMVVTDIGAAKAFFIALGMELEGEMPIEGDVVNRLNAIDDIRCQIAMMKTPDGLGRLELTRFSHPDAITPAPAVAPPNTLGLRSVMFSVDDIDAMVARLQAVGGELIGEIVQYEDVYRLCYLRGPAGIIVALAEPLQ